MMPTSFEAIRLSLELNTNNRELVTNYTGILFAKLVT